MLVELRAFCCVTLRSPNFPFSSRSENLGPLSPLLAAAEVPAYLCERLLNDLLDSTIYFLEFCISIVRGAAAVQTCNRIKAKCLCVLLIDGPVVTRVSRVVDLVVLHRFSRLKR